MTTMVKAKQSRVPQGLSSALKFTKGEGIPYRQFFEALFRAIPMELAVVVSSLPRGGLQVVQPQRVPEGFAKGYTKEFNSEDRATWQAIIKRQAVSGQMAF